MHIKQNNRGTRETVKQDKRAPSVAPQPEGDIANHIARGVSRHFRNLNNAVIAELSLADGRRCDLMTVDNKGVISIVEIKSSVADFRSDTKWPEYRQWCDLFYFAALTSFPCQLIPEDCGLILADNYGAEIIREAPEHRLNATRRKAIMLRFARCAAFRLQDGNDPERYSNTVL